MKNHPFFNSLLMKKSGQCTAFTCRLASYMLTVGCLLVISESVARGADFQNLDFESGPIYNSPDPSATYPDVLPDWTVRFGNTVQSGAGCNNFILDYPAVALMSAGGALGTNFVIAGQNSVYLQSSASLGDPASAVNVSISQIGTVPTDAQSLIFDARNQWHDSFPIPPGPFDVKIGGLILPLVVLASDGGNVTYGANVADWAGQTTELSFGVLASPAWGGANWEGWAVMDSIRFSAQTVPEPAGFALLIFGSLFFGCLHRRKFPR